MKKTKKMEHNLQFIEFKHTVTYYYANLINNVLTDPINYIRSLHDFWGDDFSLDLSPFKKKNIFHEFIFFIIRCCIDEDISEEKLERFINQKKNERCFSKDMLARSPIFLTDIEYYAHCYGYTLPPPWEWVSKDLSDLSIDDVHNYIEELPLCCDEYDRIIWTITREIFYILFLNRQLLRKFNELLAGVISDLPNTEIDTEQKKYFARDGVLLRKKVPEWAKKAVFHRDKGLCIKCNKDLTGLISNINNIHVDHIVPLAFGGVNDISNLQLLCRECNLKKSDSYIYTNNRIIDWYNWDIKNE